MEWKPGNQYEFYKNICLNDTNGYLCGIGEIVDNMNTLAEINITNLLLLQELTNNIIEMKIELKDLNSKICEDICCRISNIGRINFPIIRTDTRLSQLDYNLRRGNLELPRLFKQVGTNKTYSTLNVYPKFNNGVVV
jgi:hypothetical protein